MISLRKTKEAFPIEGDQTHSGAAASYSHVVDRLSAVEGSSRQILITSPGAAEGKTITAVNLAFAFNKRSSPVLLAELSFMRPSFAEIFGPSPVRVGMEDVIAKDMPLQSATCIRSDNNLNVIMVNKSQKTNELLEVNSNLQRVLVDAQQKYEWTILDAPSIGSTPNIRELAARVGIVLLVVRSRHTTENALLDSIQRISCPNTFVLLNDE